METATVWPNSQVAIPSQARRRLGVEPGEKVKAIMHDNRLELIPVKPAREVREFLKGIETWVEREPDRV